MESTLVWLILLGGGKCFVLFELCKKAAKFLTGEVNKSFLNTAKEAASRKQLEVATVHIWKYATNLFDFAF